MTLNEIDIETQQLVKSYSGDSKHLLVGFEVHGDTDFFIKYEDIFPLREVTFEGIKFFAPRNSEKILTKQFGDYMQFPKFIDVHDGIRAKFTTNTIEKINCLIGKAGLYESFKSEL